MLTRLERLREAQQQSGVAAVALMPGANLRYLTGLQMMTSKRITLAFLPLNGQASMVLPRLEAHSVEANVQIPLRLYTWDDSEGPHEALRRCLEDLDLDGQTLAVEYSAMRVLELRAIQSAAPGIRDYDATALLAGLRISKDGEELARMREAVRIVEAALQTAIAQIRPGMTERQLADAWEQAMRNEGSDGPAFSTSIASGPNGANPHHHNGNRPFTPGDLIVMDGGATYKGYCSDITRTVAVGEVSAEARDIYAAVLAANEAGRTTAGPGISPASVDRAARQAIVNAGYGDFFTHRTGHGLGMEVHEAPYIVEGSDEPLPVGATFTVEPGVYIAQLGGVRIEDDVLITPSGAESLTTFPRELLVL